MTFSQLLERFQSLDIPPHYDIIFRAIVYPDPTMAFTTIHRDEFEHQHNTGGVAYIDLFRRDNY